MVSPDVRVLKSCIDSHNISHKSLTFKVTRYNLTLVVLLNVNIPRNFLAPVHRVRRCPKFMIFRLSSVSSYTY